MRANDLDHEFEIFWADKQPGQWSGEQACDGYPKEIAKYVFCTAWIRALAKARQEKKETE